MAEEVLFTLNKTNVKDYSIVEKIDYVLKIIYKNELMDRGMLEAKIFEDRIIGVPELDMILRKLFDDKIVEIREAHGRNNSALSVNGLLFYANGKYKRYYYNEKWDLIKKMTLPSILGLAALVTICYYISQFFNFCPSLYHITIVCLLTAFLIYWLLEILKICRMNKLKGADKKPYIDLTGTGKKPKL